MDKFKNVPLDPDTRIISQEIVKIDGFDAVFQQWTWDGFIGESVIFHSSDVCSVADDALFTLVKRYGIVNKDGRYTVSRTDDTKPFLFCLHLSATFNNNDLVPAFISISHISFSPMTGNLTVTFVDEKSLPYALLIRFLSRANEINAA